MNKIAKQLYDQGYIDKDAAQRLDQFDGFLKEAGVLDLLKTTLLDTAKKIGPQAVGTTLGVLGASYLTNRAEKERKENELAELKASFGTMRTKDPTISKNIDQAEKRFNEIAHFSPTFAKMPDLATPLVKRTMKSGLSEKDVRNLVQIEAGKRQVDASSVREPASARLVRTIGGPAVQSMGEGLVEQFNRPEVKAQLTLKPASQESVIPLFNMFKSRGLLPSEISHLDITNPEHEEPLSQYISKHPKFMVDLAAKHNLVKEWNQIVDQASQGMGKMGSTDIVSSLSLEKRAEILADQYLLTKVAAPSKGLYNALMGLGAATLFGASSALIEEGVDYARTQKLNEKLKSSWKDTQGRLKKLSEEGIGLSAGIDYNDKENIRKAEDAFKVLTDVAPSLASNSAVAAPFVNRIVQNDGDIPADAIKMLSETQRNINTSRQYRSPFAESPLAQGFGRGFESAGGREFIKSVAKAD